MLSYVVLTPSRGLMHSRTAEAVEANRETARAAGYVDRGWRLVHGLPIPQAHEQLACDGLASGADALWFLEDDMVPPSEALVRSLELIGRHDLVAVNAPSGERPTQASVMRDLTGRVLWSGTACLLVTRGVFDCHRQPWFRTDITYRIEPASDGGKRLLATHRPADWGGQDVYFTHRALASGMSLVEVPGLVAGHAKLRALGPRGTNAGGDEIEVLTRIDRAVLT